MKFIINLEENMRQFIWLRVSKYLERLQGPQSKKLFSNIPFDTLEYTSISSNESLFTCCENFKDTMNKESIRSGNNLHSKYQVCSLSEMIMVSDEHLSTISITNDSNSYKEYEHFDPLFNDEIAGLINDMILVLEDPRISIDNLPEIRELDGNLDYQEVTRALSIT